MADDGLNCFVERKLDPGHEANFSLPRNNRCLSAITFIRCCIWLTTCPMPVLTLSVCCDSNRFLSSHPVSRCQKLPCRAVSRVGVARQCCPHMLWRYTSSRSPWLTGSPLRRSNSSSSSSSSRSSRQNSKLTTHRQRETGRSFTAPAPEFALAAPPSATRMVRTRQYYVCRSQIRVVTSRRSD